jgi:putative transposase
VIYDQYKESIVQILKDLCKWKGVEIIEGKALVDHIHLLVSIPPKIMQGFFCKFGQEHPQKDQSEP